MSRTALLLAEIQRPGSTHATIARIYADGLLHHHRTDFVDWPTVNTALLKRYRPSGLDRIKRLAWTLYDAARTA